jgi:hypothetical protein
MRRLLRKHWLWCLGVFLVVVLGPLPFLLLRNDPSDRVHEGMTEAEVGKLLGPPSAYMVGYGMGRYTVIEEQRPRFWDVICVQYRHGRVVLVAKARRPVAEIWQNLLNKVGLKSTPPPPVPVPPAPLSAPAPLPPGSPAP